MERAKARSEDSGLALKTYVKLMRTVSALTTRMHRHLAQYKLTVSQFGVLEALFHMGPLCQQEIGQKILKSSGNMTMVIDNLEKRGLVLRESVPEDRRYTRVRLTFEGRKLIGRVFPRHAEIAQHEFSVLTAEELDTLGSLLKKLGAPSEGDGISCSKS